MQWCWYMVLLFMYLPGIMNQTDEVSNQVFQEALEKDKITGATIEQNKEVPTGSVTFQTEDGDQWKVYVTDVKEAEKELREAGVDYVNKDVPGESIFLNVILPVILIGFVIILFMNMMSRAASGGGNNSKMMNFGKSRARLSTDRDKQVVFANVAGLKEEKEDLEEVVDFLKNPQKYIRVGARIPKGVLLVGPPGTGKNPAGQSGGRGSRCAVLFYFRIRFCGNVCGRGRLQSQGSF